MTLGTTAWAHHSPSKRASLCLMLNNARGTDPVGSAAGGQGLGVRLCTPLPHTALRRAAAQHNTTCRQPLIVRVTACSRVGLPQLLLKRRERNYQPVRRRERQ